MLIVPWFQQMLTLNLLDTYAAVILPQTVAPVMVFILKKHFDSLPKELEEAARIDGAGHIRIFWSVLLPLSRPMLSAVAIFVFIGAWNNFLWPFVSTSDPDLMTLPVGITSVKDAYGVQYAQSMASAVLAAPCRWWSSSCSSSGTSSSPSPRRASAASEPAPFLKGATTPLATTIRWSRT